MNVPFEAIIAEPSDIPAWLELVTRVSDSFPGLDMADYAETLKKNIARKTALRVKSGDKMAGVLLFSPARRQLSFLATDPACRRCGVASSLMAKMLELMPEGDIAVTTFREDDEKGTAPRALYRRFGFVPGELFFEFDYPVQRFVLHRS